MSTNVCNPEGYRAYGRLVNPAETEDLQFNSNTMFLCRHAAKQCQRRWPGLFYAIVLFSVDVSALPTTGYSSCGFHQNAYIAQSLTPNWSKILCSSALRTVKCRSASSAPAGWRFRTTA